MAETLRDLLTVSTITYPKRKRSDPRKQYRTTRDIVIPAGAVIDVDPPHSRSYAVPHATLISDIEADKDCSWEWLMDLNEAIRVGLIEEIK